MGRDLNLKKKLHTELMSNKRRVWEEEKKALDERKRIEQMMKERQEERQIQELQEMQEAAGGKKRLNRVDWMYSGPSAGQTGTTEEMEGYLLGKRRIDGLIKGTEHKKLEKNNNEESFIALQNANTVRDTAAKIREDPMLAIKKQEQAAYESLMNDPIKRRLLLKASGIDTTVKKDRDHKHSNHRHRRDREGHRRSDKNGRGDDEGRHSRRSRREHRRRSRSTSYSRSPSPHRRRSLSPYRSRKRSPSPYRHSRRSRSPYSYKKNPVDRSPSPEFRRRSPPPYRLRSRSPGPGQNGDSRLKHSKSWHNNSRRRNTSSPEDNGRPVQDNTNDREARLAAMQSAASELDEDRARRIAAIEEREKAEREKEDAARARSSKYGGKGDFVTGLNRKAGEMSIGERMRRGTHGLERDRDDD